MKAPHATQPIMLVILDGFGHAAPSQHNAVSTAHTPCLDHLIKIGTTHILAAAGQAVGLPPGFIGNSEVGHLTIGAGRIIKQPITQLHELIDTNQFNNHPTLRNAYARIVRAGGRLHIMGLVSDAGVHSHIKHLYAFIDAAKQAGITHLFVHAFLDGRDTPPKSATTYLEALEEHLRKNNLGSIGSLHGRFYAMDRDHNWERTQQAHQVLTQQDASQTTPWHTALNASYDEGVTDEFVKPVLCDTDAPIRPGDGIIFINFRPDRARQITASLISPSFDHFPTQHIPLSCFVTPTGYASDLSTDIMLEQHPVTNTLKELVAQHNKRIFSIAETEKYAHVTYFFSGGREAPFEGETQRLIPSISRATYAATPQMSAPEITAAVLDSLNHDMHDFYLINYANADMVAHSGDFDATVAAIECLDDQIKQLYETVVEQHDGMLFITADHGNAEDMFDPDSQQPRTAHTANPVPFVAVNTPKEIVSLSELADISPCILSHMGLTIPQDMKK